MRPVKRLTKRGLIRIIFGLLVLLAGYLVSQGSPFVQDKLEQSQPGLYQVEEVSDGDTIIVNMNGTREVVRLIGIDTPETHHPDRPVQCYGEAASEYARKLLVDKKVRLEADPLNTNRDRYDRLLRYVYLQDGILVNAQIIALGYGFSYTAFPFSKIEQFNKLETEAKEAKRGLWTACSVIIDGDGGEQTNAAQ